MSVESVNARINACRICLDTKYSYSVSFDDGGGWLKMYEFCFGLTVSPEDIPRKLCDTCVKKIKDFTKLKKQSLKADKLWRNTFSKHLNDKDKLCDTEDKSFVIKEEVCTFDIDASYNNEIYDFDESDTSMKEEKRVFIKPMTGDLTEEGKLSFPNSLNGDILDAKHEETEIHHLERPHKKIKNENVKYACKWCKKSYKFQKNYNRHVMKNKCKGYKQKTDLFHKTQNANHSEFYCGLCEEKSTNSFEIKEHFNEHSSKNELFCKLCEYSGRDFADMVTHRYSHRPKQTIECHACDRLFKTILALQYHYRSVHLKKPGGMCSVCSKEYNCYKSWRDHERWHKTAKYICDHCGRRFLYRNVIEAHMKDHADYKGYVCDICGNKFKRMSNLKLHMQQVHDNKRVTCTHCDKTFKNEKNLKIHLQREAKEKKYQCEICSKCYAAPSVLKKHMIWHTDERPFACNLCGSAYKVKNQLRIHMRGHTGDLPYKCTVPHCPKAFACSNQLKVHLNVHSGIRRYKCPYCEKTFHNKSNVVMHCAKRHNVPDVVVGASKKHLLKGET